MIDDLLPDDFNLGDECDKVNTELYNLCSDTTGYWCPVKYDNYTSYTTKVISYVHLPSGEVGHVDRTHKSHCYNQTQAKICPKGYYCPNAFEKHLCPRGKYCGFGYKEPNTCSWLLISCYDEGMGEQSIAVCLLMFSFMLALALWVYYRRERFVYSKTDGEMDFVTSHSEKLHQITEEQKRTTAMLGKLSSHTQEPLRTDSTPNALGHLHMSFHRSGPSKQELHDAEMLKHEQDVDTFLFSPIDEPLRISFDNLSLNVKIAPENILLNNIFGTIRPFQITALMGPSGAGKTTLLNLLRGQAHYANCFGTIMVNNVKVSSLAAYRSDMAFVPQDDVVYEELTVEDNILYSAMLFNRRGLINSLDLLPMVSRAEKMVGIDFIRHSIVGGAERKGISGGQRKRVSIAMEMMKEAALFFLDEPTSGLDSATSISVLHCLKELSLLGYNIVATLHQPRQEILDLLDNLILIAPGGRLVFQGQPRNLREHFMQFGYRPSVGCNMADFMMDCLAGFVIPAGRKDHPEVKMVINELCDWWQANMQESTRSIRMGTLQHVERTKVTVVHNNAGHDLWTLFHKTLYVASSRQKKIFYRCFNVVVETCFLLAFAGMAVGFLMNSVRLVNFQAPNVIQQTITGQLVFGIFITNSGLKLFGTDELMRRREEEGGVWLLPLFLGKIMSSYVEYAFYSYAFLCGYYSVIASNSTFYYYWGIYMLLHMALYSLSNLISILVSGKMKDLCMLGILVVLWLFGGVQPPYPELDKTIPVIGPIMNGLSPFRWSFQLQVVVELIWYADIWKPIVNGVLEKYGYSHKYVFDAGMLVIYSMIVNTLAYTVMVLKRDNYLVVHQTIEKVRASFPQKPASQPNGIQLVPLHDSDTVDVRIEMRDDETPGMGDEEEESVAEYKESVDGGSNA